MKFENTAVFNFEGALRSMRNPLNSWAKSDSHYCLPNECVTCKYCDYQDAKNDPYNWEACAKYVDWTPYRIGENDIDLAQRLIKGGAEHSKFMRAIGVNVDITAPTYFNSELDTYKIGTVRNSCSFMHKGVSKTFDITDFETEPEIYEILSELPQKQYELNYPYETDEFKIYTCSNGRQYEIYKNGRIFSRPYEYIDTWGTGRHRKFERKECKPSKTSDGYFEINIGGRTGEKWQLHRLISTVWNPIENMNEMTVDHKNGDKGNNSIENLQWCTLAENISNGFKNGLYNRCNSLHSNYIKWRNSHTIVSPLEKENILKEYAGANLTELANKYNITKKQLYQLKATKITENQDLFITCYIWEQIINHLNILRLQYLDTKDEKYFLMIRQLLPMGYNYRYTWTANYAVLRNIYFQRCNHRLPEWHQFCNWIESLPYAKELITYG